jgi:hypothetical protein
MSTTLLSRLIQKFDPEFSNYPPTTLYSEGWLLRLVLDWFSQSSIIDHPLSFSPGSTWFSEPRLYSAFLPRFRGDPLAELHTNADGAIGEFEVGRSGKTGLVLNENASNFFVLEAKLFSLLSKGVKNALFFDQAARNVACIAEVLHRAGVIPREMVSIGFFVLAPKVQIDQGLFSEQLSKESIRSKVKQRVEAYDGERDEWFESAFRPLMGVIQIGEISWESIIEDVQMVDSSFGADLGEFYEDCLRFNGP